jgi:hypothetical protein
MARETLSPPNEESKPPDWRNLFHKQQWNRSRPRVDYIQEKHLDVDRLRSLLREGEGGPIAISYGYVPCTRDNLLNSKDACLLAAIAISYGNQVLCVELDYSGEVGHTVLSNQLFNGKNLLVGIDLNRLVLGLYHCYGLEARVVDILSLSPTRSLHVLFVRYPDLVEDVVVELFDDFAFDGEVQTIQNLVERAWIVQALYRNSDALRSDLEGLPVTQLGYLMHEVSLFFLPHLWKRIEEKQGTLNFSPTRPQRGSVEGPTTTFH